MYEWEWTALRRGALLGRPASAGGVIAYCAGWIVFDELHINNLAVGPPWRRHGVASALLTFVLQEAAVEGATRATLEVRRSNEPARRLYERFGFAFAGVRTATTTGSRWRMRSSSGGMGPVTVVRPEIRRLHRPVELPGPCG